MWTLAQWTPGQWIGVVTAGIILLLVLLWAYGLLMERFMAYYSGPLPKTVPPSPPLILFDGVCNLCAWAVQFVINRDPRHYFRFASLQSDLGQRTLKDHGIDPGNTDSFILVENGVAYTESSAALRVARRLHRAWPLCYAAIILPTFLRDPVYRFIARHRYRWFGKKDSCMIPSPEVRALFLE